MPKPPTSNNKPKKCRNCRTKPVKPPSFNNGGKNLHKTRLRTTPEAQARNGTG
jgi:hypothetical protein